MAASEFFFLHHFDDVAEFFGDLGVAFALVGVQAVGAVFDAVARIGEIASAVFAESIEGAVAEEAGEGFGVGVLVAGEVFAVFILEKIVGHIDRPPVCFGAE